MLPNVEVLKSPGDGHSHSSTSASGEKLLPLRDLIERARAATERQQLDLADRYFSLATAHYSSRFSQESTLDHASVLLLLGESTRAASIAAALAEALPPTSLTVMALYEGACYAPNMSAYNSTAFRLLGPLLVLLFAVA
jgi:hypothetical protein